MIYIAQPLPRCTFLLQTTTRQIPHLHFLRSKPRPGQEIIAFCSYNLTSPDLSRIAFENQLKSRSPSRTAEMLGKRKRFEDMDAALNSRNVKFIVGPEKKEFTVYESSFASLSPPLRALLTGGFQESNEGKVIWDDTDPVTFVLLVQYAYSGDYSLPETTPAVLEVIEENTTSGDGSSRLGSDAPNQLPLSMKVRLQGTQHRGSYYHFAQEKFLNFSSQQASLEFGFETQGADSIKELEKACWHSEYLRSMCKSHVRLYFLADKYAIEDLQKLCLAKVHYFLSNCPRTQKLKYVVRAFVPFIYHRTVSGDPLRKLFVHYIIADMKHHSGNPRFKALRRDVPEFALDLLDEIPDGFWKELIDGTSELQTKQGGK
ncbi:hypothetical protein CSIM01_01249 [Colletotrichum simmondsii]|uniref:BTB domain-containing protein n=1 Tax=Colletotrichum simmondsii TaxID=703756 RepID=A0A135TAD9_9PEZI|nr:hypothetical protein CSIM01_01249 [Colletotrichum simmondsii]